MNRRSFLTVLGLAPVVGVMAARDVMASGSTLTMVRGISGEAFIGEYDGESWLTPQPNEALRKLLREPGIFGLDGGNADDKFAVATIREDESVSAQFDSDLAFLRDEPGVAI